MAPELPLDELPVARGTASGLLRAGLVVGASTAVCRLGEPWLSLTEQAMVYLLGVLLMAARLLRREAIAGCLASVAAYDFFFVPPRLDFVPVTWEGAMALATFLATSLVVSRYATRIRHVAALTREQERRTAAFYAMSRALSAEGDAAGIGEIASRHVGGLLGVEARVVLAGPGSGCPPAAPNDAADGRLEFPLESPRGRHGVLTVHVGRRPKPLTAVQRQTVETLAALTTTALERVALGKAAEEAHLAMEMERTRNTLLSAVSHDLRTPLATITGAAGALLAPGPHLTEGGRHDLVRAIREEGDRLGRLVTNLLDFARVGSGGYVARREWFPIDEIVGSALERVRPRLAGRDVRLDLPDAILEVRVDGLLFEQVVVNVLENAAKHTPDGSPVDVVVRADAREVLVEVLDRGEGLASAELDRVFDAYRRGESSRDAEGTGLGLALCRAIVHAHGGRIWAENRDGGGAAFRVALPREEAPALALDDDRGAGERTP